MKVTHTHRGHCQICLRVHAIDPVTGLLAVHGYEVAHGMFQGECPGSKQRSLHVERILTDNTITAYYGRADRCFKRASDYELKLTNPAEAWNGETYKHPHPMQGERIMTAWDNATAKQQDRERTERVMDLRLTADRSLKSAAEMERWADDIFEKVEAYRVKDIESQAWEIGDEVRIGGKKGYSARIEAITDIAYRTRGFRRGSQTIVVPHARVTRPAIPEKKHAGYVSQKAQPSKIVWIALREIKRPATALAQKLREAGLI